MNKNPPQSTEHRTGGVHFTDSDVTIHGDLAGRDIVHVYPRSSLEELNDYLAHAVAAYEARMSQAVLRPTLPDHPYKFLYSFDLEDASIFFGRETATDELHKKVLKERLTVLHARSGAGKTSLLNAGLSPHLIRGGRLPVYARAYEDPALAIKRAIAPASLGPWPGLLPKLTLHEFLGLACDHLSQAGEFVVILDQFEEFFIFWPERDYRQPFIDDLADCYDDKALPLRIIIALRKDYYSDLATFQAHLPHIFHNEYYLDVMTRQEAQEAITGPVAKLGCPMSYEQNLLDTLLDDLARGGMELPHLQIICTRLYETLAEGETAISLDSYEKLGRARGVLGGYLNDVLDRLPGKGGAIARDVLKELVSSEATRRVLSYDALAIRVKAEQTELDDVLARLVNARLLRRDEVGGEVVYEMAHDYVAAEVRTWVSTEELRLLDIRDMLRREMSNYQKFGYLLARERLELVQTCCDALALDKAELELVFRSALAADYEVPYWRERAPVVVGKVERELFDGLGSQDPAQAQRTASSLAALASPSIVGSLAELIQADFTDVPLIWVDHEGERHQVRRTVLNLVTPRQRGAVLALTKMILPEAKETLKGWTPPGMILILAGPFTMGSTEYSDEGPVHDVWLDAFWIDRYPVTNAQWAAFLKSDAWEQRGLWTEAGWKWKENHSLGQPDKNRLDHPVVNVYWYEALACARWMGKVLLSEAQWEKAARGTDERAYPWGDEFDKSKCNTSESGIKSTTPVGKYSPVGDSPHGVADMAGNVWEWCCNLYVPYPYKADDGREVLEGTSTRVLRGGSFARNRSLARVSSRDFVGPTLRSVDFGFRVGAAAPFSPSL